MKKDITQLKEILNQCYADGILDDILLGNIRETNFTDKTGRNHVILTYHDEEKKQEVVETVLNIYESLYVDGSALDINMAILNSISPEGYSPVTLISIIKCQFMYWSDLTILAHLTKISILELSDIAIDNLTGEVSQ